MPSNKRFNEIDALRGLAAIIVVIFHYSTRYEEIFGHAKENYFTTFEFGHYGVQLLLPMDYTNMPRSQYRTFYTRSIT